MPARSKQIWQRVVVTSLETIAFACGRGPRYVMSVMCFAERLIFSNSEAAHFHSSGWGVFIFFFSAIDLLVRLCKTWRPPLLARRPTAFACTLCPLVIAGNVTGSTWNVTVCVWEKVICFSSCEGRRLFSMQRMLTTSPLLYVYIMCISMTGRRKEYLVIGYLLIYIFNLDWILFSDTKMNQDMQWKVLLHLPVLLKHTSENQPCLNSWCSKENKIIFL